MAQKFWQFYWRGGFCLFMELHRKGSAPAACAAGLFSSLSRSMRLEIDTFHAWAKNFFLRLIPNLIYISPRIWRKLSLSKLIQGYKQGPMFSKYKFFFSLIIFCVRHKYRFSMLKKTVLWTVSTQGLSWSIVPTTHPPTKQPDNRYRLTDPR